jgi:hypothetical protein
MRLPHHKAIVHLFSVYYNYQDNNGLRRLVRHVKTKQRKKPVFSDPKAQQFVYEQVEAWPCLFMPDEPADLAIPVDEISLNKKSIEEIPATAIALLYDFKVRQVVELMTMCDYKPEYIASFVNDHVSVGKTYGDIDIHNFIYFFWNWSEMSFLDKKVFLSSVYEPKKPKRLLSSKPVQQKSELENKRIAKHYQLHAQLFWGEKSPEFVLAALNHSVEKIQISVSLETALRMAVEHLKDALKEGDAEMANMWSMAARSIVDSLTKMTGDGDINDLSLSDYVEIITGEDEHFMKLDEIKQHNLQIESKGKA